MNDRDKFWDMVEKSRVAMLATLEGNRIESRPMAPYPDRAAGVIYFITRLSSGKTDEIGQSAPVNVGWSDPAHNSYISLSGRGTISQDRTRLQTLWSPWAEAYIPEGPHGADTALITVTPEEAVIWDSTSSKIIDTIKTLSAVATGATPHQGDVTHVRL